MKPLLLPIALLTLTACSPAPIYTVPPVTVNSDKLLSCTELVHAVKLSEMQVGSVIKKRKVLKQVSLYQVPDKTGDLVIAAQLKRQAQLMRLYGLKGCDL